MSATEPNVVCGQCQAEVSAFITECPYCGARLRKRAPDLERRGDEISPTRPLDSGSKVTRLVPRRRIRLSGIEFGRPWAAIFAVALSVVLILIAEAGGFDAAQLGGISGPVDASEWWRYLVAPFVYDDVGYLFVCACAILIFGIAVESRVGTPLAGLVIIACGSLGILIGIAIAGLVADGEADRVWGGNAIALGLLAGWAVMRAIELRRSRGGEVDLIGAVVCAAVLVLLPGVVGPASFIVGLSGAAVGAILGVTLGFLSVGRDAPGG